MKKTIYAFMLFILLLITGCKVETKVTTKQDSTSVKDTTVIKDTTKADTTLKI